MNKLGYTDVQSATTSSNMRGRPNTPEEKRAAMLRVCGVLENKTDIKMILESLGLLNPKGK